MDRKIIIILFLSTLIILLMAFSLFGQEENIPLYEPIYENIMGQIPIYDIHTISIDYYCNPKENKDICYKSIDEIYISGYEDIVIDEKIIALDNGINRINGFIFDISDIQNNQMNLEKNSQLDNKVYNNGQEEQQPAYIIFDYDIGERNMEEFGRCRDYEIDKEVCHEIYQ